MAFQMFLCQSQFIGRLNERHEFVRLAGRRVDEIEILGDLIVFDFFKVKSKFTGLNFAFFP
jgi:hypothetical protein